MSNDSPIYIYALFDPRNPAAPRYIGATRRTLHERLKTLIAETRFRSNPAYPNNVRSMKREWIGTLLLEGLTPRIQLLETVSRNEAKNRRCHWVTQLRGPLLTNKARNEKSKKRRYAAPTAATETNSDQNQRLVMVSLYLRREQVLAMEQMAKRTGRTRQSIMRSAAGVVIWLYDGHAPRKPPTPPSKETTKDRVMVCMLMLESQYTTLKGATRQAAGRSMQALMREGVDAVLLANSPSKRRRMP